MSLTARFVTACRWATGLAFCVLMAAVVIQVLGRAGLVSSPVWTEELTRFALLYLVAFGAGLSFRSGDMVNVDLLSTVLPERIGWCLRLLAAGLTVFLCTALLQPAWFYVSIGATQTSSAMAVRMSYIHAAIWILLVVLLIMALIRVVAMLAGRSDGSPEDAATKEVADAGATQHPMTDHT